MKLKDKKFIYKRIILKISGEILGKKQDNLINYKNLNNIVKEIKTLVSFDIQICVVIGGGNIFRGIDLKNNNINRNICDYIGMLSTIMNGLIIYDFISKNNIKSYLMSSIKIDKICDSYNWKKAIDLLNLKNVIIITAGTGNTTFTTDSAACLFGIELEADAIFKATKVDGVFDLDPNKSKNAVLYKDLKYRDIIKKRINIIDHTACILASAKKIPIHIFNMYYKNILTEILQGQKKGTLIH